MIDWLIINFYATLWDSGLGLLCLTPLSTIFQLYRGDQLCWWRKKPPTCHKSLTKLNHIMLCTRRKPPTCHKSLTKLNHIMLCTRRKPPTCHKSLTKLYHIMLYRVHPTWEGIELTILVVIGIDLNNSVIWYNIMWFYIL